MKSNYPIVSIIDKWGSDFRDCESIHIQFEDSLWYNIES